ncbi:Uncharacterized protein pbN1_00380 [Aromatoleum bremense]|nr:Uncharacterized protein pbN1_00380 [Aromatoleum bremense]
MLSAYRVLDLSNRTGWLAGRLLADPCFVTWAASYLHKRSCP